MEETKARRSPADGGTGIGVGGSSVLAVFVVLCLTTFAVLSLVSAEADLRLSEKAAQAVSAYYQADAQGQKLLSRLTAMAREGEEDLPARVRELPQVSACQTREDGHILVEFSVPVEELQTLRVQADLTPALEGAPIEVLRYQVEVEELASQSGMGVWDGLPPVG